MIVLLGAERRPKLIEHPQFKNKDRFKLELSE